MGSSTHGAGESSAVPLTIRALGLAGHGRRLNLELTLPHFRRTLRRMAKKSAGQSESPERGSPSRSTSEISIVTRKSPRARSGEAAAGQETRAPDGGRLQRPSALLDTRVVYCGDNLEQLAKLPDACVDLIYIDPPFNSNRNYGQSLTGTVWGETKEKRAFEDRHENIRGYIDYMRPRCVQLARVLKKTGSFYYHCDWHASHYVKVMLDQIFGENNFQNEITAGING